MFKRLRKLIPARFRKKNHTINIVRLEGVIASEGGIGGGKKLNGKSLEPLLKKAFKKGVSGVALAINCPAFCEDVAASGGYWLACAADEIYADENSIVGSIGVISGGFGFPVAMKKYGIERRVHTSGESKSTNDPFKPEKPEDVKKLKAMLSEMHETFKTEVRTRRKDKLKESKELFSGAYWTGRKSLGLGLIDGLGHLDEVLKRKFGETIELVEIEAPKGWGLKRLGFSAATEMPEAILNTLEQRALWQRFGL
jgi:ClpP class serine protease